MENPKEELEKLCHDFHHIVKKRGEELNVQIFIDNISFKIKSKDSTNFTHHFTGYKCGYNEQDQYVCIFVP